MQTTTKNNFTRQTATFFALTVLFFICLTTVTFGKGCSGTYFISGTAYSTDKTVLTDSNGHFEIELAWRSACRSSRIIAERQRNNKKINPQFIYIRKKDLCCLLTALCPLAVHCQSKTDTMKTKISDEAIIPSLSTPEKSWQALLAALKSGKSEEVTKVVTEKGFQCLVKYLSPALPPNPFYSTFQTWGKAWSKWETRWGQLQEGSSIMLKAGSIDKEHIFYFIKTDGGWKMDSWTAGL